MEGMPETACRRQHAGGSMAAADEAAATCRLALLTGLAVLGLTLVAGVLSSTTTATSLDAVSAGSALVLPPGHEGEAIPRRARLRASRALCHSHLQGTYTYGGDSFMFSKF